MSVAARLLIPAPFQSYSSTPAAEIQLLSTMVRSLNVAELSLPQESPQPHSHPLGWV